MTLPLHSRIILTNDVPTHAVVAGDTGTIVHVHQANHEVPAGYEIECFTANGETRDVMSVVATDVRAPTRHEVFHVRPLDHSPGHMKTASLDQGHAAPPRPRATMGSPQLTGRSLTREEYRELVPEPLGGMMAGYLGAPDASQERLSLLSALLVNEGLQRVVNLVPRAQWETALQHHTDHPLPSEPGQ